MSELKLRDMSTAPKNGDDILLFKDVATVLVCHIARWEDDSAEDIDESEKWETGWWSYTRHSVTQEKVDEIGTLLGWMPLPEID